MAMETKRLDSTCARVLEADLRHQCQTRNHSLFLHRLYRVLRSGSVSSASRDESRSRADTGGGQDAQSAMWPPFAAATAEHRRFMDFTRGVRKDAGMVTATRRNRARWAQRDSLNDGLNVFSCARMRRFTAAHKP